MSMASKEGAHPLSPLRNRRALCEPHIINISRDQPAYRVINACVKAVRTLWGRAPAGECKYTLLTSEAGTPCDVSSRLNKLLREVLLLGDGVTGTSLRRAVVDKVMRDDSLTEKQKKGAQEAGRLRRSAQRGRDYASPLPEGDAGAQAGGTHTDNEVKTVSASLAAVVEAQGHCYETAKAHYDKQRGSRNVRQGIDIYGAMVSTHMGALEEHAKEAPTAAEEEADPTYAPSAGEEAVAMEEESSEEEQPQQEEQGAAAVPGGRLEELLRAAEGAARAKDAPAKIEPARPSLLDAILANGGRCVKSEEKAKVAKAKYGKPGRPPVSKWRWLKPEFPRFRAEDLAEVKEAAALKQLISTCIEQPRGERECPAKTDREYLRRVLLRATHRPEGYVSEAEDLAE